MLCKMQTNDIFLSGKKKLEVPEVGQTNWGSLATMRISHWISICVADERVS